MSYDVPSAKSVCAVCTVCGPCLEYALGLGEKHGIWGGMTLRQRRAEVKRRRAVVH